MMIDTNLVVRTSWTSYLVLWMPLLAFGGLYLILALNGHRDAWNVIGLIILLGLIGTACLMRMCFTLTSDNLTYRSLFRSIRIPINDIASIQGELIGRKYFSNGLVKGPGIVLTIKTIPGRSNPDLCVSMKIYSKNDLRKLFVSAKSKGLPVSIDGVIAAILRV